MEPHEIKTTREKLGLTQKELADALGVSFATVNRWEKGRAKPQKDRIERLRSLIESDQQHPQEPPATTLPKPVPRLDFEGDPEFVKLVVEAHRLQNGHIFNKTFNK